MAVKMYNYQGISSIVEDKLVHKMLKSGWTFVKPAVKVCKTCSQEQCICDTDTEIKSQTKPRRKPVLQIQKAEAEVLKPNKEEE